MISKVCSVQMFQTDIFKLELLSCNKTLYFKGFGVKLMPLSFCSSAIFLIFLNAQHVICIWRKTCFICHWKCDCQRNLCMYIYETYQWINIKKIWYTVEPGRQHYQWYETVELRFYGSVALWASINISHSFHHMLTSKSHRWAYINWEM